MKIMNKKAGFTLLELLTVMTIIAIISGVALVSYINMQSGGKYLSLARNIQNQAMLARQQAIMQNRPTCLLLSVTDDNQHEIAVVFHAGVVTDSANTYIQDAFANTSLYAGSTTLYNFNTGIRYKVNQETGGEKITLPSIIYPGGVTEYERQAVKYVKDASVATFSFNVGDAYGFIFSQPYRLPKNITFDDNSVKKNNPLVIYFDTNGVMYQLTGTPPNQTRSDVGDVVDFQIRETIRGKAIKIAIKSSGVVEVVWK